MSSHTHIRAGTACYHVLHSIPPVAAHEMNFFVDEGLTTEDGSGAYQLLEGGLVPFNVERLALDQAMKERGVSIAMDVRPSSVVYLNRRGADLRIIAGWRNQMHNWVMATKDIETLSEVRGRLVGLKDFNNNRFYALAPWLQELGIDPRSDVRYVRNIQDGAAALRQGVVDVAFVAPDDGPAMLEEGYSLLGDLAERFPQGRPDRIIVATQDLIDARRDWVLAYVRAMIRSYWFVRTMPENLPYVSNLERRLRLAAHDPDERNSPYLACASIESNERMPFPIDGIPTGLEEYLQSMVDVGELDAEDARYLEESLALDVAREAFRDLESREELAPALNRAREVVQRVGY